MAVDIVENLISSAEVAYKSGHTRLAIRHAKSAVKVCSEPGKLTALRIFIARAYSRLGKYRESSVLYRELIDEKNYLPPVIMGLLYNNFHSDSIKNVQTLEKISRNLGLIKIFVR